MKQVVIFLILVILVCITAKAAEASRTRVYISISVGGAVVVAGGFIYWGLTYGSEVSQKDHPAIPSVANSFRETQRRPFTPLIDFSEQNSGLSFSPLDMELPLFIYRW